MWQTFMAERFGLIIDGPIVRVIKFYWYQLYWPQDDIIIRPDEWISICPGRIIYHPGYIIFFLHMALSRRHTLIAMLLKKKNKSLKFNSKRSYVRTSESKFQDKFYKFWLWFVEAFTFFFFFCSHVVPRKQKGKNILKDRLFKFKNLRPYPMSQGKQRTKEIRDWVQR